MKDIYGGYPLTTQAKVEPVVQTPLERMWANRKTPKRDAKETALATIPSVEPVAGQETNVLAELLEPLTPTEGGIDLADMSPFFEAGEQLTAPISEYEQQALDVMQQLAEQLGGMGDPLETPMGQNVGAALTSLLSGEFPEEFFQKSIADPTRYAFEEEMLPGIREAFVGPGTYWGGARASEETKRRGEMERGLTAVRGELGYKARQMAMEALTPGMKFMEKPLEQTLGQMAGTGVYMSAAALPRLIEQHGLDIAYQEFIRTRPENQPYAEMLMSMLGIPMMGSYAQETAESPLAPLGNILGSFLPQLLGGGT